jgi:Leucine-rich repeat (LRR) protein
MSDYRSARLSWQDNPEARLAGLAQFQREFHRKKFETEPFWSKHGLDDLKIDKINVTDVAPLAHLEELRYLSLGHTAVSSIDPLHACKALCSLNIPKTEVRNLGPRGSFGSLHGLNASETRIENLRALEPASALQWLDITHTGVSDLTPIQYAYECRSLNLRGSQVENLHKIIDTGSRQSQERGDSREGLDFRDMPASRVNSGLLNLPPWQTKALRRAFLKPKRI